MASTYTGNLRFVVPTSGELSGTWGDVLSAGFIQLADTAISGTATLTMTAADYTLTALNGAADESRNMFLLLAGSPGAARSIIVPSKSKLYFVKNSSGFAQTVKTTAGTGISVPDGKLMVLYCDATNVVDAVTYLNASVTGNAGTVTNATLTTALTIDTGTVTLKGDVANTSALTLGAGASSVSGVNTGDQTSVSGNAGTVTGATFTTTLTVNTGTVTFKGNAANTSVLTLGAGASSVSGANTGDQTSVSGNAGGLSGTPNIAVGTLAVGTAAGSSIAIEAVGVPSLLNSWVDFGLGYRAAGYWKDIFGVVHLCGVIKGGGANSVIFNLPAGYLPTAITVFAAASNPAPGFVSVRSTGEVVAVADSTASLSLDGITFRTT